MKEMARGIRKEIGKGIAEASGKKLASELKEGTSLVEALVLVSSISNPYLTCLGPTNIKGIALSIISRGGHALSRFGAPPRLHTTEVATTLAIT